MGVDAETTADTRGVTPPSRTCVVTRTEHPQDELLRFVLDPAGEVVPDVGRRLPGRGVWVTPTWAAVAEAVKTRAFNRGFKGEAKASPELPALVERLLVKRVCDSLSLCNKAGLALTGMAKVEAAVAAGTPIAILHASDASEDGVRRLDRQYLAMCRDNGRSPRIVCLLSTDQLSLAIGRSNVVHAALKAGGVTEHFLSEAGRWQRYASGKPSGA